MTKQLTPEQEALCLRHAPFETDKGDDIFRVMSDKFVTGRNLWQCAICLGLIPIGARHRLLTEIGDSWIHSRICPDCCEAMAAYEAHITDETFDAVTERYDIGYRSASMWPPAPRLLS